MEKPEHKLLAKNVEKFFNFYLQFFNRDINKISFPQVCLNSVFSGKLLKINICYYDIVKIKKIIKLLLIIKAVNFISVERAFQKIKTLHKLKISAIK